MAPVTELLGAGGMGPESKVYFSKELLARLTPALVHADHGLEEDVPPHAGKQIEKRRFESYAINTAGATLTEGTPPPLTQGTWTATTVSIVQYGAYSLVSDVLEQQGFDGIEEMVQAFGEHAGLTLDTLIRDTLHTQLVAASARIFAGGSATRVGLASGMRLTNVEIRKAVRKLRAQNAKTFDDGDMYHSIIHPDVEMDLMSDPAIIQVYQQTAERGITNPMIQGAVPAIYGAMFFRTSNAKVYPTAGQTGTTATDVYATLFFGKEAYLVTKFSLQNVRTIIKGVGTAGPVDPLDQFGSIGWKASLGVQVLNTNAAVLVESTASQSINGNG